jgi:hypothetical protein
MTTRPYHGAGSYGRTEDPAKEDGEGRKRKVGTRRTVDYGCTNAKYLTDRLCRRSLFDETPMRPALNDVINVVPSILQLVLMNRCNPALLTLTPLHL